jgi:hypothetical protein
MTVVVATMLPDEVAVTNTGHTSFLIGGVTRVVEPPHPASPHRSRSPSILLEEVHRRSFHLKKTCPNNVTVFVIEAAQ